jgi:hypothetical protein
VEKWEEWAHKVGLFLGEQAVRDAFDTARVSPP